MTALQLCVRLACIFSVILHKSSLKYAGIHASDLYKLTKNLTAQYTKSLCGIAKILSKEYHMNILFKKIINANVADICALKVFEDQKSFVAPNTVSLAEAFASRNENIFAMPFGIYDENTLIGFIMFGYDTLDEPNEPEIAKGNYIIWRLMIDQSFQGKGYAEPILKKAVEYIETFPAGRADYIWLSYEKENARAREVYYKFGFRENGEMCGDEIVAVYSLKKE